MKKEIITREDEIDVYILSERNVTDKNSDNVEDIPIYAKNNKDENDNIVEERQEFVESTRNELMLRAGLRCSNPYCRKLTIAYDPAVKSLVSIGEAAHIIAAKKGGPRYPKNEEHKKNEIKNIDNGIWLCRNCHSMIDKKCYEDKYTVSVLHEWKTKAESLYINQLVKPRLEWINTFSDDFSPDLNFKLEEATSLQIALISYCIFNDKNISFYRQTPGIDDIEDDGFYFEYSNFYNWITSTKFKKIQLITSLGLQNPLQFKGNDYKYAKFRFEDSLLANNMTNLVEIDEKEIKLSNNKICKELFNNNLEKIEDFCNKIIQ